MDTFCKYAEMFVGTVLKPCAYVVNILLDMNVAGLVKRGRRYDCRERVLTVAVVTVNVDVLRLLLTAMLPILNVEAVSVVTVIVDA